MKWLVIFGITFFCLGTGVCNQKVYITPDQVHIRNEGIFINFLGNLYSVNRLSNDTQGLHVMANEMIDHHSFSWTCPKGHPSDGTGQCNYPGCQFGKREKK